MGKRKKVTTVAKKELTDSNVARHRFAGSNEVRIELREPSGLYCLIGARVKSFYLRFRGKYHWIAEFDAKGIAGLRAEEARLKAMELRRDLRNGLSPKQGERRRASGCGTFKRAYEMYLESNRFKSVGAATKKKKRAGWMVFEQLKDVPLSEITSGDLQEACDHAAAKRGYSAAKNARDLAKLIYKVALKHPRVFPGLSRNLAKETDDYSRPKDLPPMHKPFSRKEAGYWLWYLLHKDCPIRSPFRGPLLLLLLTGVRFSDAAGIHAAELDFHNWTWAPISEDGRKKTTTYHFAFMTKTFRHALEMGEKRVPRIFPAEKNPEKWPVIDVFADEIERARKDKKLPLKIRHFHSHDFRHTVLTGMAEINAAFRAGGHDGLRQRFVGQKDDQANAMDSVYNGYQYYRQLRDMAILWEAELYKQAGLNAPVYSEEELALEDDAGVGPEGWIPGQGKLPIDISWEDVSKDADILRKLVWEYPGTKLAEHFGKSETALRKICKKLEIERPPQGHWTPKGVTPRNLLEINEARRRNAAKNRI